MELTSYYENVFYASSARDNHQHFFNYPPLTDIQNFVSYNDFGQNSDSSSSYGQYSPSNSPISPSTTFLHTPSSASSTDSSFFTQSPPGSATSRKSKLPKIPPLEILQQRRLAANARERKRANKINFAFNRLRRVLPGFTDREISKFEAIQLARDYIHQLSSLLESDSASIQATNSNSVASKLLSSLNVSEGKIKTEKLS